MVKKLEQGEVVSHHKDLILDPLNNHHHHLHLYKQLLNPDQESDDFETKHIAFHGFHHQIQQNQETPRPYHRSVGGPAGQPPRPRKKRPFSPSAGEEYAPERMEESYHYHHQQIQQQQQPIGSSRFGLRSSGGEIVEVEGGHIVRSTGRKDRHSKVCTSKGPRDRRVRLSAHTAIQFYDVQDRLGYDRPSKAVDWLIKKAKAAIDKLAELPAWKPTATTVTRFKNPKFDQNPDQLNHFEQHPDDSIVENPLGNSQNSSFLPPALDSAQNPANNNQSFPPLDLLSRTSSQSQDLRLSLQSFKDPLLHTQETDNSNNSSNIYFDGSGCQGWSDNPSGGFQRMASWGGDGAGFVFNSQPAPASTHATPFLQPLFGQTITNELFNNNSRREPLQSSITPSFRAWIDPLPPFTGVAFDQHPTLAFYHPCSGLGGFSGFGVPARIQGDEEEHDGVSDGPSSASSDSRH